MVAVPEVGVTRPTSERRVVRLARSVRTEEADDLALVDVEAQVVDGADGAEVLGEVLNRDDGHVTVIVRSGCDPPTRGQARDRGVNAEDPSARTPRMKITITGASGLIGAEARRAAARPRRRGHHAVAQPLLRPAPSRWQPEEEPRPGRGARRAATRVIHLAGENVAQRWSDDAKRRIRSSRELGTRNLVAGIEAADPRPRVLVSSSAVGYYGPHGDEQLDEQTRGRRRLPRRGVRDLGARGAARGRARPARRLRPHRRRARPGRRRAGEDAAVLQARRRRPGRGRRPVHAVDPRRRRGRHLPRRARRRRLGGPDQRERARAGHQQDVLQGARPRAAPARRSRPCPASRSARSTARWPRSSPRASA